MMYQSTAPSPPGITTSKTPTNYSIGERYVMDTKNDDDQRLKPLLCSSSMHRNISQDSFDSCSSSGSARMRRRMDKTLRLKSMSAAPPTSSNSRFPRQKNASFGSLARASNNNNSTSFGSLARFRRTASQSQPPQQQIQCPSSNAHFLPRHHASAHVLSSHSSPSSGSNSNATFSSSKGGGGAMRANAMIQMAQRSNGSTVKSVLSDLQRLCLASTTTVVAVTTASSVSTVEVAVPETIATGTPNTDSDSETNAQVSGEDNNNSKEAAAEEAVPTEQMEMLAQWASADTYYRVLISKYQGIPAILNAMESFPLNAELQANALIVLQHLNKLESPEQTLAIIHGIVTTLENHGEDVTVQSEGWTALKPMGPLLCQPQNKDRLLRVMKQLPRAQKMSLTPMGKASLTILVEFLVKFIARQQQQTAHTSSTAAA